MRFLFIAPRFHTNQHFWVKALIGHGHEVQFWVWNKQEMLENYSALTPILLPRFRDNLPNPILFFGKMRAFRPDAVIIRDPRSHLFAFVLLCIARLQRRTIVIYSQTPLHQPISFLKRRALGFVLWFFGAVWLTPAKGNSERYPQFHRKAFYIPFAIEVPKVFREGHAQDGIVRVFSVGKLYDHKKQYPLLLEALSRLRSIVDVRLTIAGALSGRYSDYPKEIDDFITTHNLQKIVEVRTNLSHEETLAEYSNHDLFVLASTNDILAYSPLEAMAAGLPVICSDTNGAKWYIKEGGNGYVFKSGDSEDLYEKMRFIVTDKKTLQDMGRESRRLVETNYTTDIFYQKIVQMMETIGREKQ